MAPHQLSKLSACEAHVDGSDVASPWQAKFPVGDARADRAGVAPLYLHKLPPPEAQLDLPVRVNSDSNLNPRVAPVTLVRPGQGNNKLQVVSQLKARLEGRDYAKHTRAA